MEALSFKPIATGAVDELKLAVTQCAQSHKVSLQLVGVDNPRVDGNDLAVVQVAKHALSVTFAWHEFDHLVAYDVLFELVTRARNHVHHFVAVSVNILPRVLVALEGLEYKFKFKLIETIV